MVSSYERAYSILAGELDAAIVDGARWQGVCDILATVADGVGTALVPFERTKRAPWMVHSESLGGLLETYIRDGWHMRDAREATFSIMRRRGFATDLDIAGNGDMRRSAYYADFVNKAGFGIFIGIHLPTPHGEWCAAIQRSGNSGPPDTDTLARIPRLHAMLTGAMRSSGAIGGVGTEGWAERFDEGDRGFALLDRGARICRLNRVAEDLLLTLMGANRELLLPDSGPGLRLAQLLQRACAADPVLPLPPPVVVTLGDHAVAIDVVPLPSPLRQFHSDAVAVMTVRPSEPPATAASTRLEQRFKLTAAEARLALRIGGGDSLRGAAEAESITYETARTRLKRIFAKTGAARQAELTLIIARMAAG